MSQADNLASLGSNVDTSGTLQPTSGGTGRTSLTANNVILGNGANSVSFVAPGANANVLTSNGTTWVSQAGGGGGGIPAGTVMIFGQTAAPTGFTKLTNLDNYALRVVSGTAGTGGSVAFTTAFASGLSAGATTLSTTQIPSHSHNIQLFQISGCGSTAIGAESTAVSVFGNQSTQGAGSGGSHTHTIPSLAVQYVDVIRATKD